MEANFAVPKHLHQVSSHPVPGLPGRSFNLGYRLTSNPKTGYSFNDPSNLHRHPDYYKGDKKVIKPIKKT